MIRPVVLVGVACAAACAHDPAPRGPTAQLEAHLVAGREAHQAGRTLEALAAYDAALALDASRLEAHRGRVRALYELGRVAEAEDRYRAQLAAEPASPYAAYGLALARYATSTRHAAEALALLARAETALPGEPDLPFRRGIILLDAERYLEAKETLGRAVALDPKSARYLVPYALALFHTGEHDKSLSVLGGLLELDPDPASVAKAREVANRICDPYVDFPPSAQGRIDKATEWLEKADVPQNAIDLFREVLLEYPEAAMVHALTGLAYQRLDNGGQALVHLRRAVELAPQLPQPHLYLGNFYYGKERYAEARENYLVALEKNPLYVEAHVLLGRMALDRGDEPEAIRHLRAWALLSPAQARPRLDLARAQASAGDLTGAEDSLKAALRIDPNNLEAHLSLGAVYARRRQLATAEPERRHYAEQAKDHLEQVLDAQPENAAARRLLEQL